MRVSKWFFRASLGICAILTIYLSWTPWAAYPGIAFLSGLVAYAVLDKQIEEIPRIDALQNFLDLLESDPNPWN